jgi:hypothetical protein
MRTSTLLLPAIFIFAPFSHGFPHRSDSLLPRGEYTTDASDAEAIQDTGLEPDRTFEEEAQTTRNPAFQTTSSTTVFPGGIPTILPSYPPKFASAQNDPRRKEELKRRAEQVKAAFVHSWEPYQKYGLPDDELRPASREPYSTRYVICVYQLKLLSLTIQQEWVGRKCDRRVEYCNNHGLA